MAVTVIDTIKPKNNGTFPVVEAPDVKVSNSKRLDAALNEKANQSDLETLSTTVSGKADKTALAETNEAVAGKQNALTEEQLAAANSGITSELVTQIGTNTTAIAGKADSADVSALEIEVDGKADSDDLTTATNSLQAQIDNIVGGSTEDSEVINARVGADGTSYNTLKARLDAEETAQQNSINTLESDEYFEETKSKLAGNVYSKYDATELTRNWGQASTTTLMNGVPITNAIKLKTVKYNVGNTDLYQVHWIGLATISGSTATITHLKRNAGYFKNVVTADVNFNLDPTKNYYIFLICDSGVVQWQIDNTGTKYYTFANPSTPTVGTTASITENTGNSITIAEYKVVGNTADYFASKTEVENARVSADGTNHANLKARLDTENTELKNDVQVLESNQYIEEIKSKYAGNTETRYNADNMTRNWAQAATTAIMHGVPISNGIKLKTIKYNIGNTELYQAHEIGLATIEENTATITHIVRNAAGYSTGVKTVNVDFVLDPSKVYYLFIICESGVTQWDIDNSGSEYYTFPNPANPAVGTTVSLTKSTGNSIAVAEMDIVFETDGYFLTTATAKQGVITVAKSGGDYTTLAEAIAAANDSAANPVTIQLYPGVYNEHITLLNHYISIIGVNRDTCIIRDDSGKYNNDPIKISGGKWRLENLSLISTHSNAGGWTPSWVFPDLPSYALHIDNGAGGEGVVENCYLYCENLNAIGAGTHNGEKIQIINCEIVRNTTDANYVSSDYKGAVACHSPNIYDDSETASEFSMYNCNITCNLDEALQLKALANTCKMKCAMVGNTLVANNKVTNVVAFAGSLTTKNDYIKIQSHGNSTSELNMIE